MLNQKQQFFEQIKKAENILITFGKTWDGDSVASALALFLFLKKIGKNAEIAADKMDHPKTLAFLPSYGDIKYALDNLRKFIISLNISQTKVSQIKYRVEKDALDFIISPQDGFFTKDDISTKTSGFKYDLVIVVDTRDLESLGRIYDNDTEFFYSVPVINIDHHPSNEEFGQINLVELTAVATAEVVFSLLESYSRDAIDENIATCLLAGMISKTRSFKTPNVTPTALSIASQLISMGARREEIVNYLYRSRSLNVLKLWGLVLARLTGRENDKLIWSVLKNDDFSKTGTDETDLAEVIDELIINIPQAKVIVIIFEATRDKKTTADALIFSTKSIDSLSLVKELDPTGTKNLARLSLDKPLQEAEKAVVSLVADKLSKLPL